MMDEVNKKRPPSPGHNSLIVDKEVKEIYITIEDGNIRRIIYRKKLDGIHPE